MYNPFSLEGKTILVTGASSGIGRAIAVECSRMGATIVLNARNEKRLNDTFNMLVQGNHTQIIGDITQSDIQKKIADQCPILQGVVLCAGIVKTVPFKFITEDVLLNLTNTNFFSPMLLTKELLRKKKIEKSASIVFISSINAYCVSTGNGIYSATKGAMNSMAKTLAWEVSSLKIRVNCVLPAMVKTKLIDDVTITQEELVADQAKYPLGYGEPEDVAYAVIYLLSDAAKWITGSEFIIDGGVRLS